MIPTALANHLSVVIAGPDPAIHSACISVTWAGGMDARLKAGHDGHESISKAVGMTRIGGLCGLFSTDGSSWIFHGSRVTSDAGLLAYRELDDALGMRARPSVSTRAWRLRPLTFFPAFPGSGFAGPRTGSPARPAGLGSLDALAVDDRRRGAGLATGPLAVGHDQGVVDPLEQTAVAPRREPAVDRAPRREVRWQKAPGDPAAHDIEDGVDDLAQRPGARPASPMGRRQKGLNHAPFRIAQVALVAHRATAKGDHKSSEPRPLNPFRNGLSDRTWPRQ